MTPTGRMEGIACMRCTLVSGLLGFLLLGQMSAHVTVAASTLQPPPGGLLPLLPRVSAAYSSIRTATTPIPSSAIKEYPVPTANGGPNALTVGPNFNVWFTEFNSGKIAQISGSGQVTEYTP